MHEITVHKIEGYIDKGMTQDCLIAIFDYCLSRDKKDWAYINSVIKNKIDEGIVTPHDFEQSNEKYSYTKATQPERKKSNFHNFEQRDIDFAEIEKEHFDSLKNGTFLTS